MQTYGFLKKPRKPERLSGNDIENYHEYQSIQTTGSPIGDWMFIVLVGLLMVPLGGGLIAAESGFDSIFDGRRLKDWSGDPKLWSVLVRELYDHGNDPLER